MAGVCKIEIAETEEELKKLRERRKLVREKKDYNYCTY